MHKFAAGSAVAACLFLCSCAATVTLPTMYAAVETAATPESAAMGLVLPQTDAAIPAWLVLAALQSTPESALFLLSTVQLDVENIRNCPTAARSRPPPLC